MPCMIAVRRATLADCAAMCRLHIASILEVCARFHRPEQVEAWTRGKTPEVYAVRIAGPHLWLVGVTDEDPRGRRLGAPEVVGLGAIDLAAGEVSALYVAPAWVERGVGRKLYAALEEAAVGAGHTSIKVESTLAARAAYERYGFRFVEPTTHLFPGGVEVEVVRMRKDLSPAPALHTLDPTGRFTERVKEYAAWRPTYPAGAVDAVLAGLGEPEQLTVVDVGAGTGISTRLIAARGARVVAIEPNRAMREEGAGTMVVREAGGPAPGPVEWREGTGEATGLGADVADCVLCAQSFHWLRDREALSEFARVLRPGTPSGAPGRVALMWNDRDKGDPFTEAYSDIIREASRGHPAERDFDPRDRLSAHEEFTNVRLVETGHRQALDEAGVVGRAMSASYAPKDEAGRDRMIAALREAFLRHAKNDRVDMVYVTRTYLADVVGQLSGSA